MMTQSIFDKISAHQRVALSFSGGKDSLACVYLLRPALEHICIYHVDTGDYLPEALEVVRHVEAMVPHFIRIETNVLEWIKQHGQPSDLVPYTSHPIGRAIGEERTPIVGRYDCCSHNIMQPVFQRVQSDGCTLLIRGTKASDMPKLPVASGDSAEGVEVFYPLQDWSDADVWAYLKENGAPINRAYGCSSSSLDCARCTAWWSEGRGAYLAEHHPGLLADYRERLGSVWSALIQPLTNLHNEFAAMGDG